VDEALTLSSALKNIAKYHVPLLITIKDMRLYEMAQSGVENTDDIYQKAASMKLIEEREKIQRVFIESGIAVLDVPPDRLSVEVVNKYLTMKSMMQI
jgi:uncharacterized protein (DUF58 family)